MVNPGIATNGPLAEHAASRGVVPRIAGLAAHSRERELPVVHSTIELRPDHVGTDASCLFLGVLVKRNGVVAGRPAAEIHPELAPHDSA